MCNTVAQEAAAVLPREREMGENLPHMHEQMHTQQADERMIGQVISPTLAFSPGNQEQLD